MIPCHGAENEQGTFNEFLYYKSILKHRLPRRENSSSRTCRFGSRRGRFSGSWNRGPFAVAYVVFGFPRLFYSMYIRLCFTQHKS